MYLVVIRCSNLIRSRHRGKKFCSSSIIKGYKKECWFWDDKNILVYSSSDTKENVQLSTIFWIPNMSVITFPPQRGPIMLFDCPFSVKCFVSHICIILVINLFNIADIFSKQTGFAHCFEYKDNKTVVYVCTL